MKLKWEPSSFCYVEACLILLALLFILLVPNKDKYLIITTCNVLKMDDLFVNGVWFSLFNLIGQDHYS
jgi:hypothetical protein